MFQFGEKSVNDPPLSTPRSTLVLNKTCSKITVLSEYLNIQANCSKKEGGSKKKINRSARVPFNSTEIAALEDQYKKTPYLTSREVSELAKVLRITESRVKVWFQNRRARDRREIDGKVYRASSYELQKMKDGKTKEEVPIFSMENTVLTAYSQCQAIFGRMISNLN
ncbi:hypothetical protein QYM36_007594 [Artemia franciscana]|uniref:Homeobox domain-containing protein n=1 Tax=Artemia franciscana TaxID=6661 RepID=A0AA88IU59_ARTSF|nr:hypothetical protein QYM36_007594 [Artemia franciscana]